MKSALLLFLLFLSGLELRSHAATLSVINYGAVPDDGGDDLTAIQNAINAATTGDTVYFPEGTYRISGSVVISGAPKSGIHLEGTNTNSSVLLYVGGGLNQMIGIGGYVANVTISHLTLDGNGSASVKDGILAGPASGLRLENLVIRNLGNASEGPRGIRFDSDVTDSFIVSNRIENIGTGSAQGAGIRLAWRSSRNWVTDNVISNTGRGGIFCNNDSTDNVIVRNVVGGSGGERLGIEAWGGCHRTLIEDNRIDHWLSLDGSDFCAVRRNTVSDKSGNYAWAGLEAISQNSVFTDNLVDGGAQVGISQSNWQTKEYLFFARNTIKASGMWGLLLGGTDGPCQYQYFYQNKFLSSIGTQPPAQYSGQGDGVYINNNCYYLSFASNEISFNYLDGIVPVGTRATQNFFSFTGNTIQNNGNGGVWDGFSTDLEWTGNTISGNHAGGADWNTQLTSRGFANQKPVADFTCPATATPGQSVSFTNTSSDADGTISRVLWDFGDGLPSTNFSPTHAYASTGLYTVALVVWDNGGRGMLATRILAVNAGSTGGPAPWVDNGAGATGVTHQAAWLTGTVISTSAVPTDVVIAWGTSTNWTGYVFLNQYLSGIGTGHVAVGLSGLNPNTAYAYRCYATNSFGTAWAEGVAWFTTAGSLPFLETFEERIVGPLDLQNGWQSVPSNAALVQSLAAYAGSAKAGSVSSGMVYHAFSGSVASNIVWIDLQAKLPPFFEGAGVTMIRSNATAIYFVDPDTDCLVVYDGAMRTVLTNRPAVSSSQWTRFSLRCDYGARKWDLWLNGTNVARNLGFYNTATIRFTRLNLFTQETLHNVSVFDNVSISPIRPPDIPFIDDDHDDLDDDWENLYFGSTSVSSGGSAEDWDKDNFVDRFEFLAGTDPTNQASLLAITDMRSANTNLAIGWTSVSNKLYAIIYSTNLTANTWFPYVSNLPATPPVNAATITVHTTPVFYRIRLQE